MGFVDLRGGLIAPSSAHCLTPPFTPLASQKPHPESQTLKREGKDSHARETRPLPHGPEHRQWKRPPDLEKTQLYLQPNSTTAAKLPFSFIR